MDALGAVTCGHLNLDRSSGPSKDDFATVMVGAPVLGHCEIVETTQAL